MSLCGRFFGLSRITLISRTLASLPVLIYRDTPEGRVEQPDHPVARCVYTRSGALAMPSDEGCSLAVYLDADGRVTVNSPSGSLTTCAASS